MVLLNATIKYFSTVLPSDELQFTEHSMQLFQMLGITSSTVANLDVYLIGGGGSWQLQIRLLLAFLITVILLT